ncbi:MAG: hypothetical protein ACMZ64_11380 [Oleiphilus sp.]
MLIKSLFGFVVAIISLASIQASAQNTHQYVVGLSSSSIKFEDTDDEFSSGRTETKENTGYLKAYLSPVVKSSELPYARAGFYNRVANLSLSANQLEWKNLNTVVRGQILKATKSKRYSLSSFLAHQALPVWAELGYQYLDEARFYYASGVNEKRKSYRTKEVQLGLFLTDRVSIFGRYEKTEDKTYGFGFTALFELAEFGFLEPEMSVSKTDRDSLALIAHDDHLLNRDVRLMIDEKEAEFKLTYYPIPQSSISLIYQQTGFEVNNAKDHYYSMALSHYFIPQFKLGLHYTHKDAASFYNDYKQLIVDISTEF